MKSRPLSGKRKPMQKTKDDSPAGYDPWRLVVQLAVIALAAAVLICAQELLNCQCFAEAITA
jgi:hypothetical protein